MRPVDIFDRGDGRFGLHHGPREVGWVEDRSVGFRGFEGRDAALAAASSAYDALSAWFAGQRRAELVPRSEGLLDVLHRDEVDWLALGGVIIGRLIPFEVDREVDADSEFGFELHLPPRVGSSLAAAQIVDAALRRDRKRRAAELAEFA